MTDEFTARIRISPELKSMIELAVKTDFEAREGKKEKLTTDDIVARLRILKSDDAAEYLAWEAADEIVGLRSALQSWRDWYSKDGSVGGASLVYEETRAALAGGEANAV